MRPVGSYPDGRFCFMAVAFERGVETWAPMKGREKQYLASSEGRIKGIRSGKIKTFHMHRTGYWSVNLCNLDGSNKPTRVHRLICATFHDNPENKPQVNHLDGNKLNNAAWNVEWSTCKENNNHARATGLMVPVFKLSESDVAFIIENYWSIGSNALQERFGISRTRVYTIAVKGWRGNPTEAKLHGKKGFKPIIDLQTGVFYDSVRELSDLTGMRIKYIHRMLNGEIAPNGKPRKQSTRYSYA